MEMATTHCMVEARPAHADAVSACSQLFRFTAARNTQKFRAAQKGPVLSESSAVFGLSVKIFS